MILELQEALKEDGINVSLASLCHWFGVPRRTVYYRPIKGAPKVKDQYVKPIKAIEENSSFGYHTVAHLLDMNNNTVQRVVPDHGLAGSQTACGVSSEDPCFAFSGHGAQ
jgi:putative transposase